MLKKILCTIIFATQLTSSHLFAQTENKEKPPLRPGKVIGELAAGTFIGFLGGFAAYKIQDLAAKPTVRGFQIGYGLGVTYGVIAVGNRGGESGSFLATAAGSAVGVLLVFSDPESFASIGWIVTPVCATIGYNLTRKYDAIALNPFYDPYSMTLALSAGFRF